MRIWRTRHASQWGTLSYKESERVVLPKILVYTDISESWRQSRHQALQNRWWNTQPLSSRAASVSARLVNRQIMAGVVTSLGSQHLEAEARGLGLKTRHGLQQPQITQPGPGVAGLWDQILWRLRQEKDHSNPSWWCEYSLVPIK